MTTKTPLRERRFKLAAASLAAAFAILVAGFWTTKANAGFEDEYYTSYQYYSNLYSLYGYDYYTYYLGLAIPSYYYYAAVYFGGYYSVYADNYGEKASLDSYGLYIFETYAAAGDTYFLNYY